MRHPTRPEFSSPVTVVKQASEIASQGLGAFLRVLSGLSLALAFFYLLPLPALDGGRLLLITWQAATHRRLSPRAWMFLHALGFCMILGLGGIVAVRPSLPGPAFPDTNQATTPGKADGGPETPDAANPRMTSKTQATGLFCELYWGSTLSEAWSLRPPLPQVWAAAD